uniref:uncharacterized protein zgc:113184 n=1 Tax=Doryrhamphus excisus TaxID=161450 RepID=UPI0025AEACDC|nr:uncharacterized protein zgc:113184 [Doryrhamphus excisus]XP_057911040.1 uncharacterized protein zgc:113184 [Doryrhamphus excisus]
MEEAYMQLYQEFVHLRSLCLRQAALLHHLMAALQKKKGTPEGDLSLQCTSVPFQGPPIGGLKSDVNMSHLLTEDMSKLCLKVPDGKSEETNSSNQSSLNPSSAVNTHHHHQDAMITSFTERRFLGFDFPSLSGRLLMSDVALQSNVCDFCQAVFPGHTTTRGQFLQHLHNHVT